MSPIYTVMKIANPEPGRSIHKWVLLRDERTVRTFRTRRAAVAHIRALGLCVKCSAPWKDDEPTCRCERAEAI